MGGMGGAEQVISHKVTDRARSGERKAAMNVEEHEGLIIFYFG